tara:strand:+ start:1061 stop:1168 length:108 start_codon:yes stop_codon:yes gene_type:complete
VFLRFKKNKKYNLFLKGKFYLFVGVFEDSFEGLEF